MTTQQKVRLAILVAGLAAALPAPARADGFISPFAGRNFGTDSACPSLSNCERKNTVLGVSFGVMGDLLGFEEEVSIADKFFGDAPNLDSSAVTLMSNLMFVPKIGPVRPYGVVGLGLVLTRATLKTPAVVVSDNNNLGFDIGGGLAIFFGEHVGIRGDIRAFRTLQDLSVFGFTLSNTKLEFGRVNAAVIFKF
jgi:opacity protein-like surface antigen